MLTPAGVTRKVQLTLGYVERFHDHYRRVRALLRQDLLAHTVGPESRIAVYGTTELAELMYLVLRDMGVTRIDFYDADGQAESFLGLPVRGLDRLPPGDYVKVAVAYPTDIDARCRELYLRGVSPSQIITLLQTPDHEGDPVPVPTAQGEL